MRTAIGHILPSSVISRRLSQLLSTLSILTLTLALLLGTRNWSSSAQVLTVPIVLESLFIIVAVAWDRVHVEDGIVSPIGLFLALEWVRGCLVPLLDMLTGPTSLPYRHPSSASASMTAALLATAFGVCVFVGWSLLPVKPSAATVHKRVIGASETVAWTLTSLGLFGVALRFPSGDWLAFLRGEYSAVSASAAGITGFVGSVLRPLLPVGVYLLWEAGGRRWLRPAVVLLIPAACLALASFSLNRASLLLPPLALLLAASRLRGSLSFRVVGGCLAVGAIAFLTLGAIRTDILNSQGGRFAVVEADRSLWATAIGTLQVYGQSPYLTGVLYERGNLTVMNGHSLVNSFVSPFPSVGAQSRDRSGSSLYNRQIYGSLPVRDQILPLWVEVEKSLGLAAMLMAGLAAGAIMRLVDAMLRRARDSLEFYGLSLASLWMAQVSVTSLQVLVQVALYFLLVPWVIARALRSNGRLAGRLIA